MRNGTLRDAGPENTASGTVDLDAATLTLRDVNIDDAPDAIVLLTHDHAREGAINLGPLIAFQGTHEYRVPDDVDASQYGSVTVWCEEYSVPMGFAELE
ncbi:MAG: hypothetical protein ACJAR2_002525 [Ilumatobacter sp.]|jgi:hypothetical protein